MLRRPGPGHLGSPASRSTRATLPEVRLGLSARACLALIRASQGVGGGARARRTSCPRTCSRWRHPILGHRLLLTAEATVRRGDGRRRRRPTCWTPYRRPPTGPDRVPAGVRPGPAPCRSTCVAARAHPGRPGGAAARRPPAAGVGLDWLDAARARPGLPGGARARGATGPGPASGRASVVARPARTVGRHPDPRRAAGLRRAPPGPRHRWCEVGGRGRPEPAARARSGPAVPERRPSSTRPSIAGSYDLGPVRHVQSDPLGLFRRTGPGRIRPRCSCGRW